MMTNPLVSVIVPIYNVDKYVEGCLDSILSQTYLNFETILVNDGSTDNSLDVCENWIQKNGDSRFKLLSKSNGGLSSCRNFGLQHCSYNSEFVIFLDSDDELTSDCLEVLLKGASHDTLVIGRLLRCRKNESTEINDPVNYETISEVWSEEKFLEKLRDGIINSCGGNCYSLKVIKEHNITFRSLLPEDTTFNIDYLTVIDKVVLIDRPVYLYYIWNNSMSSKPNEEIYINYMNLQERLYGKVYESDSKYIDAFVYPQYRANTMKFIMEGNYDIIKKYFSKKLIRKAFKSYAPTTFGDWLIHMLMRYNFFRTIRLLSRGK